MKVPKQNSVEQSLRFKVLFSNRKNQTMNLLDRMNYYNVNGISIAVINDGKIDWVDSYGIADAENGDKITTSTLFQAGSISKSITALGTLYLVQEGLVSLDEDVNKYLKSWHIPENKFTINEKVTLRRILSHSAGLTVSGFPGYEFGSTIPSVTQILDGVKPPVNTDAIRVDSIPGVIFRYSGGGTTIAQLLIEDMTGQPFHLWMEQYVLSKLGMALSTFDQYPQRPYFLSAGHDCRGNTVSGKHHIYPEMAAAGLWSSAEDIAKFTIYLINAFSGIDCQFLNKDLILEMLKPQIQAKGKHQPGLGVFLQNQDDEIVFEHGGQDHGFIALYRGLTRQKCGFVIMMNADANGWYLMEEIANSIADVYQWKDFAPIYRSIGLSDKEHYKKFAGTYKSKENDRKIVIQTDNKKLFLKEAPEMPQIELYPDDKHHFFTQEGNHDIEFKSDTPNTLVMKDNNDEIMTYVLLKEESHHE